MGRYCSSTPPPIQASARLVPRLPPPMFQVSGVTIHRSRGVAWHAGCYSWSCYATRGGKSGWPLTRAQASLMQSRLATSLQVASRRHSVQSWHQNDRRSVHDEKRRLAPCQDTASASACPLSPELRVHRLVVAPGQTARLVVAQRIRVAVEQVQQVAEQRHRQGGHRWGRHRLQGVGQLPMVVQVLHAAPANYTKKEEKVSCSPAHHTSASPPCRPQHWAVHCAPL